ncbi:chondrolectin isoform X2 [Dendropsophus ebraccatus]|uniref:chondrolectin isoform X2 n=1 Tax=Dendropsophus ebraccatus TaxID=150705 RepID=UPI003831E368
MYPMLYSNLFLVLLNAILGVHSSSDTRIVSGRKVCYADYKHPCYKIAYFQDLTARVGYHQARQVCEGEGGHLLSIESEAEQKLIERMLQNLTNSGSGKSDGDFWIGLSRNRESMASSGACPDLYKWDDGSPSPFRNWYADEPSCGSEACVVMYHQPTANPGIGGPYLYQWNDDRCNMKHNFICKYPPDPLSPVTTDITFATGKPEDSSHVSVAETGLMPNLIYVIIPTIPLLLLILVALGTCCFQMLHKSKERSKTSPTQSTLWISKAPRSDITMEV